MAREPSPAAWTSPSLMTSSKSRYRGQIRTIKGLHDVCQDEDAFHTCHELARREGLLVGGSAGLNTWAAVQIANNLEVSSALGSEEVRWQQRLR